MRTILCPYFIERKTNVSKKYINKLSAEELVYLLDNIEKLKGALKEKINENSLILESQFAKTQNKKLLNIKRDMYNFKKIKESKLEEIDDISKEKILDYIKQRTNIDELEQIFREKYQQEKEANRTELYKYYKADNIITKSFPIVNDKLDLKYKKYIDIEPENHTSKIRKFDHQLIRFLSRATMKTSPFSWLTSVSIDRIGGLEKNISEPFIKGSCEINNYIIRRIYDGILEDKYFLRQSKIKLNLFKEYETYFVFLGQRDYERGKIYKTVDFNIRVNKSNVLKEIVSYIGDRSITYNDLEIYLTDKLGMENSERYIVNSLLKNNIITVDNTIGEFKDNIFDEFISKINKLNDDENNKLKNISQLVLRYKEVLNEFEESTADKRFILIKHMNKIIEDIGGILKINFVHDILLYEDTFYENSVKKLNINEETLNNLSKIQEYVRILDQTYLMMKMFSKAFLKEYKYEKVNAADLDPYKIYSIVTSENADIWKDTLSDIKYGEDDELGTILKLKNNFKEFVNSCKSIEVDRINIKDFIDNEVKKIPKSFNENSTQISSTILCQKSKDKYIINKLYNGRLIFFTRFLELFPKVLEDEQFKEYIGEIFDENTVEIREAFGFNASVHPNIINRRLELPLSNVDDSSLCTDKLKDCYFKYDEKKELVKIYDKNNFELDIVYLGTLAYSLIPTMMRAVLGLEISTRFDAAYLNFWNIKKDENEFILDSVPELSYDNIVLIRKQWMIKDIFSEKISEEELYKDVILKFKKNDMPLKFFVKGYMNRENIDFYNLGRTDLKPQYIDLTSPLMFKEFILKLKTEKMIIIEEINPYNDDEEYIYEFQIEYTTFLKENNR